MITSLPSVSHEHHERLMRHVDELPPTGDLVGTASPPELEARLDAATMFLTGALIPHMEAAERTLYPELERMFQNRHSMTPMRREHGEIRRLVDELVRTRGRLGQSQVTTGDAVALRRTIFRLYAMLKIHLAEELLYIDIIEHGISSEAGEALAAALVHEGIAEA